MERYHGPYRHRNKWRIIVTRHVGGKALQSAISFDSEREAAEEIENYRLRSGDRGIAAVIDAFLEAKKAAGSKATTLTTDRYRLAGILGTAKRDRPLLSVGSREAKSLYTARTGKAADTHIAELSLVRAMWDWARDQGWVRENPWDAVTSVGKKRSRPKDGLRVDEAKKLLRVAIGEGSKEGLAVAMTLLLGLRASEVTSRKVRDVDDGGRLLWVPCSKTPAGVRQVAIPDVIRQPLQRLIRGKSTALALWGTNRNGRPCDRHWLEHHSIRLCQAAKVPVVRPHALRGLHATIATANDVPVDVVARALGHAGSGVTRRHYIAPGTEAAVRTRDLSKRLSSG